MNDTEREMARTRPTRRGSAINAVLLGLLGIFEAAFDMLSLLAALLGGVARDTGSTNNTSSNPSVATEELHQLAPQIGVTENPARRPVGITIIAILLGLLGIFEFGFGALALVTSLLDRFLLPLQSPAVGAALGVYYMVLGLVKFFFVWGLYRLQRWAFWATVFIAVISLLSSILGVTEPSPTVWGFLADLVIPAAILVYFVVDSNVRKAFRI
jgi:hypothetical protein